MTMVGSKDTGYFRSKERCYSFGYKGEVPINTTLNHDVKDQAYNKFIH